MSKHENTSLAEPQNPINAAVLVLDESNTLSLAASVDPMRAANRRSGKTVFNWSFYTPEGGAVTLTSGLEVQGAAIATLDRCDLLLLIAGFNLETHATPRLLATLRRLAPHCDRIAGVDGGSWILARAGLLDGQTATTHWEDLENFATRFPRVNTVSNRFAVSGRFLTSGGAIPSIDMMLHLIRDRFGTGLARSVASAFIHDPFQSGDLPQFRLSHASLAKRFPVVARALARMETHIDTPLSVTQIAEGLRLSVRRLELQFASALGQSPKATYMDIRLSEAHRLALETNQPVQELALAVGFSSQASFSRAFRGKYGQSVRDLRKARI
ncbi:MAG: AraC family transcriptional regulator [Rhodobacterales bacterium]|nr:MAG: AraC family transcriptional regulator [Rhodobacterales bacterium]